MGKSIIESLQNTIDESVEYYKSQKIVLDLWQEENNSKNKNELDSQIAKFFIESICLPSIESEEGIESRIKYIVEQASNLQDSVGDILDDNESQVDGSICSALEMILNQVERFTRSFSEKSRKYLKGILSDEGISFEKKQESYYELVQKNYSILFDETISAIYRGMKMTGHAIYDIVLCEINSFLKNTGIYTKQILIGEKMNFDLCEYADESSSQETESYDLDDCIYEIRQYPYFADNEQLLSAGKVCTWRLVK